jgi:hypothetical protein
MPGMKTVKILDDEEIVASGTFTSAAIDISRNNALALHVQTITGTSPDVTFTYSLSTSEDGTYVTPNSPATVGANVENDDVLDFSPEAARYMKITATNNNGVNEVTLTCVLAIQEL